VHPKVRYAAIAVMAEEGHPIQVACRVLGVAESGFFAWRTRAPSVRSIRHAWLTGIIRKIHIVSNGIYGGRRVHAELTLAYGITVSHGAVEMLMRRAGIKGLPGNKRKRPVHQTPTATDLVDRKFARQAPNQLWVTDINEHPIREGKVHCAVVLDAFSRKVVGWSIDASQTAALVTNALGMAIGHRTPTADTVIHSDHGVQFTSWAFTCRAKDSGLLPSMGSIGDCLRQRGDRVVLGTHANRTAQPQEVEDPD
jgi:transposase InsO family protein